MKYKEKIAEKTSYYLALNVVSLISEAVNTVFKNVYYNWNVVNADPDDNEFLDAAIAGNAEYIVTNDAHFNAAKKMNFPKVNIISANEFLSLLSK